MIIYHKDHPPYLADYGIEVPMLKSRAETIFKKLERSFSKDLFFSGNPTILKEEDFLRVHTKDYLSRCLSEPKVVIEETFELIKVDGSYNRYNPEVAQKDLSGLINIYKESCSLSFECLLQTKLSGFSYFLGGGFHHALTDRGRGFCVFNDIIISARKFQKEIQAGLIWVIDIDAHKGCGTAEVTKDDNSIETLSIHMAESWPLDSQEFDESGNIYPWFIPSSVDVGIRKYEESIYLEKLSKGLSRLENKSKNHPILAIIVDGSDPYEKDILVSSADLKLTKKQCFERNMFVYNFLKERDIPQAYLMSGGYGEKNWEIHYQFIKEVLTRRTNDID